MPKPSERRRRVADTGFRSRDPRFAEAYRYKPPEKSRKPGERRSKWYQTTDFQYDPDAKTCHCPAGHRLKLSSANVVIKGRRGVSFEGTRALCQACPLKAQCMRKPEVSPYRQVTFFDGRKVAETHPQTKAMKARIDTREGRLLYSRRLGIVEPFFGHLAHQGTAAIHATVAPQGRRAVEALCHRPQRAEAAR